MIKYNTKDIEKTIKTKKCAGYTGVSFNRKPALLYTSALLFMFIAGLYSCKSPESLTKRLFMQSKRANLELPSHMTDPAGKAILNEDVTYLNEDNRSQVIFKEDSIKEAAKRGINEMQYLSAVTVTARIKQQFTPERNGKVNVDFMVRVPKELISPDWRVRLSPRLLHNDSVVPLKDIILKGENFLMRQKEDSLAYDTFEQSIIPESSYGSLFLDHKGIAKDMRRRQEYYWKIYNRELQKVLAYYKWKHKTEDRYYHFNIKKESWRQKLYHGYMRQKGEEAVRLLTAGIDTTGLNTKYMKKFNRRAEFFPQYHLERTLQEKNIPGKYRAFYQNEPDPEKITNHSITDKDSVTIARHRYFFDRIAGNEYKDKNRDNIRLRMITFPKEEGYRLDSIVNGEEDFVYYYSQQYPVTPGLKRLRIVMDGRVTGTDHSGYSLPPSDTLHYVISSLAQLADTSLMVKRTKLYRNMYDKMTLYPQFEPNRSDFKISYSRYGHSNRRETDTLIGRYRQLAGMGLQVDSLELVSWGSLDGDYDKNHELSGKRAQAFGEYLRASYPSDISHNTIKTLARGEDWQGLVNKLRTRNDIQHKDSILAMIGRTVYPDQTEQEIRRKYKRDYKVISDSIYPDLRRIDITFHLSRPGMIATDSIQVQEKHGYKEGLRLLLGREYWQALEILGNYPDYNTALCLACLGYNGKAYDLLVKLSQTAGTEYLLAIICKRMGKQEEATVRLLKAVELDPAKAYRIPLDPEVSELVNNYKLQSQIDVLVNNWQEQTYQAEETGQQKQKDGEEEQGDNTKNREQVATEENSLDVDNP